MLYFLYFSSMDASLVHAFPTCCTHRAIHYPSSRSDFYLIMIFPHFKIIAVFVRWLLFSVHAFNTNAKIGVEDLLNFNSYTNLFICDDCLVKWHTHLIYWLSVLHTCYLIIFPSMLWTLWLRNQKYTFHQTCDLWENVFEDNFRSALISISVSICIFFLISCIWSSTKKSRLCTHPIQKHMLT